MHAASVHLPVNLSLLSTHITGLNARVQYAPQPFYGSFFWDHPGEPVPEENFWTLWCKARLTEADTPTIQLGTTPSRLTSAHLHHPPHILFSGQMPFLPPNQQLQSTEGRICTLVEIVLQ